MKGVERGEMMMETAFEVKKRQSGVSGGNTVDQRQ